jgi:sulfur carrier protein ThiS adenylyltransferase
MSEDGRYSRQKDVVTPERIAPCKATVIGVGAIGRQVALQLAAMGVSWLQLVDHDHVETSNLASQGYLEEDLDKLKVEATAALCKRINASTEIISVAERFRRSMEIGNAVFCCVDRIDVRRLI